MKRWIKVTLGLLVIGFACVGMLVALLMVGLVPPANANTVTSIVVTFSRSGPVLNADPEDDLFIYVEEYASPFRINRAAEGGFLAQQFVDNVQPGDQIEILAFKRYLPRNPQSTLFIGSVPTWNVLQGDVIYMPNRQPEQLRAGILPGQ